MSCRIPMQVNSMLLDTRDEVYEFRDKFQSVFRPYFDVVPFSKIEFYRLLCADACSLSAKLCHKEVSGHGMEKNIESYGGFFPVLAPVHPQGPPTRDAGAHVQTE